MQHYLFFKDELSLFSIPEQKFAIGWAHFVHFIAATLFNTNYTSVTELQWMLPHRVLLSTDQAPFIPDMSRETNLLILAMHQLADLGDNIQSLLNLWTTAMSTAHCRELGRSLLYNALQNPLMLPIKLTELTWHCLI